MRAVFRKRLRALGRFVFLGTMVGAAVGGLIQQIEGSSLLPHTLRGAGAGILIGGLVGFGEEFVFIGRRLWRSYRRVTCLRVVLYTLVVVGTLVVVNGGSDWLTTDVPLLRAARGYAGGDTMGRDVLFAIIVALLGTAFLEIRRLHNPGDIRGLLTGRYRYPVEETRIFLFADLAGSTGLAERLGPHTYSRFLGDCFRDLSEAILSWKGQVHQYVGDEVVVSWPFEEGITEAACVQCFFGMRTILDAKRDRYRSTYECTPHFRGAIHGGPVVTSWVGLAKMQLAFHGDALNATARIQGLCKEHGVECLVSGPLMERLSLAHPLRARSLGRVELRGGDEMLEIFAVDEAPPSSRSP